MKNFVLLFLPAFFLFSGCSVSQQQNQGTVAPKVFHAQIPFETFKGVIGLDVTLNGTLRRFLFDTGADLNLIQRDSLIGKQSSYSGASKRKMNLGKEVVSSLKIGTVDFQQTRALNGNLEGLKEQIPNFGGIIGQPIIRKANWLIDYPGKQLTLSNQGLADGSYTPIEIVRENGHNPYTFLEMNGQRFKVIIDLGSSSVINLPTDSEFAEAVRQTVTLSDNTRDRYTLGGLQKITEKVGVIPKIRLGDFEFEQVDVNINTSSQPRIGMPFFKDYLVYIDNANGGGYKLKAAIQP
ncbi:MAG: hypothetical protein AAFV07_00635 [Bacteroidota bacterium]